MSDPGMSIPLADRHGGDGEVSAEVDDSNPPRLDRIALGCLAIQHASSSWGYRSAEFAFPLYFVSLFPNTLLPSSLYGLLLLVSSLLFSPAVGYLIDKTKTCRLRTVRCLILAQKITVAISYLGFVLLFYTGGAKEEETKRWGAFVALIFVGSLVVLSNTGVTIAVERDWVSTIAAGRAESLTKLNTIIRRIDLLSKLLSPLFVSLLTSTTSNRTSAVILLGINSVSLLFEWVWIGVVYHRFTVLGQDERLVQLHRNEHATSVGQSCTSPFLARTTGKLLLATARFNRDAREFLCLPTLPTSIALALLYTNVLSFDGTFVAYLKQPHPADAQLPSTSPSNGIFHLTQSPSGQPSIAYTDAFIAGMRGLAVVFGLLGTFLMPVMEKHIGLVRTGSWALGQEFFSLVPTVVALWIGVGLPWNTALLFTGMTLSRLGLWTYDLVQLSLLQQQLYGHSNGAFHFAMQQSLLSLFDISHFVLTLVWSRPAQFAKPATISVALLAIAWAVYAFAFAKRQRGHIVHLEMAGWTRLGQGVKRRLSRSA